MIAEKYSTVYFFLDEDEDTQTPTACFPESMHSPTRIPERALCAALIPETGTLNYIWIDVHEILDCDELDAGVIEEHVYMSHPHIRRIDHAEFVTSVL